MPKESVIAFTVAIGEGARREAGDLERTFRYHHPRVPFFCFGEKEYEAMMGQGEKPSWLGEVTSLRSVVGWFLSQFYERVICLDTDIFVLGEMGELLETEAPVLLTSDLSTYIMKTPELATINSGVLSAADENFWRLWTWRQYAYLLPAQEKFYFNQLALRLLAHSETICYAMLDEWRLKRIYNASMHEYAGEFRGEDLSLYKGDAQVVLYHMAGVQDRSVEKLPAAVRDVVERTLKASEGVSAEAKFCFDAVWREKGELFRAQIDAMFEQMPILKLEQILEEAYAATPGFYRSAAPLAWDRKRDVKSSDVQRILNTEKTHFFLYTNKKSP